jgi:WD40 repeat protein
MISIDPAKTREVAQFQYSAPFLSCRFDPAGRFLFAGAQDNTVQRWELGTGTQTSLTAHKSWVRSLAFLDDGNVLVTAGYEGHLNWWPATVERPEPFRSVQAHKGWIRAIAVSPDGKSIATAGNDRLVKLFSASDGTLIREMSGHEDHVYNVAFHPSGEFLVSADLKLAVRQWRVDNGEEVRTFDSAGILHTYDKNMQCNLGGARSIAFSPDGSELLLGGIVIVGANIFDGGGGSKPTAVVIDWESGERKLLYRPQPPLPAALWGLRFHPDGFWIGASGGAIGGHLLFWKQNVEYAVFHLKLPAAGRDLALHPDQNRLAIPHYDDRVRIFALSEA